MGIQGWLWILKIQIVYMYKRLFLFKAVKLFLFTLSLAYTANAQGPYKDVSIASPNAASLGKYADIPVNYHTGIPQISIPVYNVKAGSLELPVSLSYHAGGIKMLEPSSWVGAGWSLSAGGVITRTVQGTPDEYGTGNTSNHAYGYFSEYGISNYMMVPSCNPGYFMEDGAKFVDGTKDGEPDLFFFNFAGLSGKFYFRDDRTPIFVPQQDIKVEYNYTGTGSIQGFILTAPDGSKYYFGNTPGFTGVQPIEKTKTISSEVGVNPGTAISSWYLHKIVSADDKFTITLTYQQENYGFFTTQMFPLPGNSSGVKEYRLIKNVIEGVKLSRINFPNGTVNFTASTVRTDLSDNTSMLSDNVNTQAKSLDVVNITDSNGYCKKVGLWYSYFTDNTTSLTGSYALETYLQTDKKRLKLDSIKESTCDDIIKYPPHKFEYFTEMLPRRLAFSHDHWGFNNGVVANTQLIPTYTEISLVPNQTTVINGANREPAWPQMRAGALNKITYPTGGSSTFDFEPNTVYTTIAQEQYNNVASLSIGFDGSNPLNVSTSISLTAGTHKLSLSNTGNGTSASLSLRNSSNTLISSITVAVGQASQTITFTVPADGTHTLNLYKDCMYAGSATGNGASGSLSKLVPVTVSQNTNVGGLRIKNITNYDGINTANNTVTNYDYNDNTSKSNGILYSQPVYVQQIRNDVIRDIGWNGTACQIVSNCSVNGCITCDNVSGNQLYYKSPNSLRPMGTTQGNHIGYSSVKVYQTNNGYSTYKYYINETNPPFITQGDIAVKTIDIRSCYANTPNTPAAPVPFDYKRGQLEYEKHYNQAGQLLKEVNYYPEYTAQPANTPAMIWANYGGINLPTKYNLGTSKKTKFRTVETSYSYTPSASSITSTNILYYESAWHNAVTKKQAINSLGDTIETKIKYTNDFRITACDNIASGASQLHTDSVNCYNTYVSDNAACGGANPCITNAYLKYLKCLNDARISYVNYRKTNFTNISPLNTFQANHNSAKTAADTELKPILEMQDQNIVTEIEQSTWRRGLLTGAALYRYAYAANPSGKVYPQKTQSITVPVLASTFTPANTSASQTSVTEDTRYKDEASYKFHAGNPAEVTPKSGITLSYLWNYKNSLPVAQVTAAAVTDIAYTSFEADSTGNFSYGIAKTADISAPTGSYCYNLTSGTVQRSSLTSTKTYILSYWYKGSASVTVTAGTQSNIVTGPTRNGWTYKQLQFTGTTTASLSGTGFIDEVRIYPLGAQMSTYTYSPLIGMTSACDANNKITYYEFDKLARLKNTKDQNRNITKNYFYNYAAAPSAPPSLFPFKAHNTSGLIFTVKLTSKTTGQVFDFTVPAGVSNYVMGNVPSDIYDVFVNYNKAQGVQTVYFQLCTYYISGLGANFYNVSVTATSCNTLLLDTGGI
jgi:hypothetical protein